MCLGAFPNYDQNTNNRNIDDKFLAQGPFTMITIDKSECGKANWLCQQLMLGNDVRYDTVNYYVPNIP